MKHIIKPAITLFVAAAIAAVSLGLVYEALKGPTEINQRKARELLFRQIFPGDNFAFEEIYVRDTAAPAEVAGIPAGIRRIFAVRESGKQVGYVVEVVNSRGYGGELTLMVGFSLAENRIAGLRVLSHKESPGFGNVISRPAFGDRFRGLGIAPFRVVRDRPNAADEFQAISRSTITTNAVIGAVNEAVSWFENNAGRDR
ncbi:MAG: RnfABCDGE type electron transport complex subunit G [Treponema sp.]|jgi:electron transport complex protein RnfG|nr:RnfABCDGE type electron transport complex subunit G [Treponema sp.]